jgi:hypothetical protein
MSFNIIVKNYEHYNKALGKYITSKRQYDNEMAKQGMVSFEKGDAIAKKAQTNGHKPYILTDKAKQVINCAKLSADRKGNVKLSDKLVEGMKEVGVNLVNRNIPDHYRLDMGGFCDATHQGE